MPTLLTQKYRSFLAKQFLLGISSGQVSAYLFLGQPVEWADPANNAVSDSNPAVPVDDTQEVDFDYWRDMLGAKRITANTAQIVAARIDWTANTVYAQYDDLDATLATKSYYVLTNDAPLKVYKCVWNNYGVRSTVNPNVIGTNIIPQQTSDGYVWQYMYTISSEIAADFLTTDWMPVLSDNSVQASALTNAGVLPTTVPLLILNGGSGYNALQPINTTVAGDGAGANVANTGVQVTGGVVSQVVLSVGGAGYTEVSSINVFQTGATLASVRAIIPPFPNHGYDPIKELGAAALMLTAKFIDTESGQLTADNDYRRIGLLINPDDIGGNVATGSFYRQTTDITISANTGVLLPDDTITNQTKNTHPTATVVDIVLVSNNYVVRVTHRNDVGEATPYSVGDTIKNVDSGVEATVASVDAPELQIYSGDIVWVDQRTPVSRDATSTETWKIVFPVR